MAQCGYGHEHRNEQERRFCFVMNRASGSRWVGGPRKWRYGWLHLPTGKTGVSETFADFDDRQFISALSWWNQSNEWRYWPLSDNEGILPQHMCANVDPRS